MPGKCEVKPSATEVILGVLLEVFVVPISILFVQSWS